MTRLIPLISSALVAGCSLPEVTGPAVPISATQATRLDFSSGPATQGSVGRHDVLGNMGMRWKGRGTIGWRLNVEEAGSYEVSISVATLKGGGSLSLLTDRDDVDLDLPQTAGHFDTAPDVVRAFRARTDWVNNYQQLEFSDTIQLKAGEQDVFLRARGLPFREVIDFRALQLTPTDALDAIQQDAAAAAAARSDTTWMVDAGYGLMVHWTDLSVDPDGSSLPYADAVDEFDVEALVELSEQAGAGYVLFTLNHQYPHCPAPIPEWEAIHPGWTTERDLIGELADAFAARDIPFMLYVASHLVGIPDDVSEVRWLRDHQLSRAATEAYDHPDIFDNNRVVLEAIGERYGDRVAGFWLDGWDLVPEVYPHPDPRLLHDAAKAGYPDRLVSLNRWIFPTVTPWQDYWAGEIDSPEEPPKQRYIPHDAGLGLQYHALIALEDDWVYTAEGIEDNLYRRRYSAADVIEFVEGVSAAGGAVTINVALHQRGTIEAPSQEILTALRDAVR